MIEGFNPAVLLLCMTFILPVWQSLSVVFVESPGFGD
jgi:hypothetical protein